MTDEEFQNLTNTLKVGVDAQKASAVASSDLFCMWDGMMTIEEAS